MVLPGERHTLGIVSKGRDWKYGDLNGERGGRREAMRLQAGAAGDPREPKLLVKGQGLSLPDPTVPVPEASPR